ncbi:hypothetical protein PV409_36680 [Streptomyces sp. ME02-6979.5a]|uniref:hypothetical protein n=1 Tax=unclassified Streptomyces TaxID=2593676 RepID=UPI0029B68964|nr:MULTISPECIES: hypothetical protein [unclassified Streptomyces]MDX3343499.1 hypothetical protein [Streptomyces sp. ME02-6979.5a]MDX5526086.1 hypothetical protein [Streptomyces sp. DE06-01C]
MPLYPVPILTDGATHSAEQFRAMVQDLARGAEGITAGTDLKVTQLGTPGTGVQVASGSGVVRGRVNAFQGSYAIRNQGADTVDIASTGGSGRSDMLILRVEDPQYEGTLNPETDEINYFQIISNVSSSATTIPDGRTGIPLARIDIPASTSTITNAMIKDIRQIANPRRERQLLTFSPGGTSTSINNSNGTFSYFSTVPGWNIAIPTWASTVRVRVDISQIKYSVAAFIGQLRATFGASLTLQPVILDDNQTAIRRQVAVVADTLTIPDAYRGTTQLLRPQAAGTSGNGGTVAVDGSSTLIADIEFFEAPR